MVVICTICARGGSKGVPGKNLRMIAGKPLIAWTVSQAKALGLFDLVAVSSDDKDILNAGLASGADLLIDRPIELATDQSGKLPAILHAAHASEAKLGQRASTLVDLDATSPLRDLDDIIGAVDMLRATGAPNIITGTTARRSPYFNLVEKSNDGTVHISKPLENMVLRRQDSPRCFDMNGSIYVWNRDIFFNDQQIFYPKTRIFEMPEERSIDIDCTLDFQIVEFLLLEKLEKQKIIKA